MNSSPHEYDILTAELSRATRSIADVIGAIPTAYPNGRNPNGGGPGPNYFDPHKIIETLRRFAAQIQEELTGIERWRREHPAPGPDGNR